MGKVHGRGVGSRALFVRLPVRFRHTHIPEVLHRLLQAYQLQSVGCGAELRGVCMAGICFRRGVKRTPIAAHGFVSTQHPFHKYTRARAHTRAHVHSCFLCLLQPCAYPGYEFRTPHPAPLHTYLRCERPQQAAASRPGHVGACAQEGRHRQAAAVRHALLRRGHLQGHHGGNLQGEEGWSGGTRKTRETV